ncbi:MAG: Nif11-like leader peptide family natural product precursor [Hydrococcus sp. Prado102]|jgi:predicted ribosomally synthesized peptide with nif11-like leader|nr:Nif11-like leader peptide family natural product precursor [Hydrococcus sp. Prado102]
MSANILEKVKEFLLRLVKDEAFRERLQTDSFDEARKILQDDGYNFSKEEFETAAIQLLDLKERGEFHELTEEELVGAVGGIAKANTNEWAKKGKWQWCPVLPPKKFPKPCSCQPLPQPQPMYGVVIDPKEPIIQPMYGVVVSSDF